MMDPVAPVAPTTTGWVEVAGFWVALVGTVASVIIAVAAVVLSVKAFRAEAARATRAEEVEKRLRRSDLARDIIVWFDKGIIYMTVGSDAALLLDDDFVRDGQELDARARTIDSPGATDLLLATREARRAVGGLPEDRRMRAAINITRLLKLWAERWVDDPKPVDYPVDSWVRGFDTTPEPDDEGPPATSPLADN